jgi:hypothetical protein
MSIYELIVMVISLIVCGLGSAWLIYDMKQQIKMYEETMNKNNKEDK